MILSESPSLTADLYRTWIFEKVLYGWNTLTIRVLGPWAECDSDSCERLTV